MTTFLRGIKTHDTETTETNISLNGLVISYAVDAISVIQLFSNTFPILFIDHIVIYLREVVLALIDNVDEYDLPSKPFTLACKHLRSLATKIPLAAVLLHLVRDMIAERGSKIPIGSREYFDEPFPSLPAGTHNFPCGPGSRQLNGQPQQRKAWRTGRLDELLNPMDE